MRETVVQRNHLAKQPRAENVVERVKQKGMGSRQKQTALEFKNIGPTARLSGFRYQSYRLKTSYDLTICALDYWFLKLEQQKLLAYRIVVRIR